MESVRDRLLLMGSVDADFDFLPRNFPPDWQYCPCVILQECIKQNKKYCQVKIGISFRDPNLGLLILEIIYLRENKKGIVRTNQMQLNRFIDKNILKTVDI